MSEKLNKDFWKLFEDEGTIIEIDRPDFESIVDKKYVKDLRLNLNLTQKVLGDVLGVTKKTIEKWEQGVNPIKGPSARLIYLIDNNHNLVNELYSVNIVKSISIPESVNFHIKQVVPLIAEQSNLYKFDVSSENFKKNESNNDFIVEGGILCQKNSSYQLLTS
ncbi:MAG: helix-turn-helix domain-containing protein [Acholeplasma sp.]|nr:helix-turn-helix domain-containing protein [Acholeplasma sp.]